MPAGTPVRVVISKTLTSKQVIEGSHVSLRVTEDVLVDGQVVITAGTPVIAEVSSVTRAGRLGRGGDMVLHIRHTTAVDQQLVHFRADRVRREGDDHRITAAALSLVYGVGLMVKGREAVLIGGEAIIVYTDADVRVKIGSPDGS